MSVPSFYLFIHLNFIEVLAALSQYSVNFFCKVTQLYIYIRIYGFPGDSVVKNLPANAGDAGSDPGWEGSPGEGNGN